MSVSPYPCLNPNSYTGSQREDILRLNKLLCTPAYKILGNVPPSFLIRTYDLGYTFYQAGDYAKAEALFRCLTLLDHLTVKYWKALGACQQMQGKLQDAIHSYIVAFAGANDDVDLFLHLSECAIAVENFKGARMAVAHLLKLTKGKPEHEALFHRAEALMEALQKKDNENSSADKAQA